MNNKQAYYGLIVLMVALMSDLGFAQSNTPNNRLTFTLGSSNGLVKDELYSPLNYTSNGGTIGMNYQKVLKNSNLIIAEIDLKTFEIATEASEFFLADQLQLNMEVAYFIKVRSNLLDNSALYFGLDLHSNGNLIAYDDDITLSNSGTFVSHRGIGLQAIKRNNFGKNTLNIQAKLPVVGAVYRSPYNLFSKSIDDDQLFSFIYTNSSFGAVHNYFNPSASFTLSRSIFSWFQFSVGYELEYLKSTVQEPITDFHRRLLFSTTFQF